MWIGDALQELVSCVSFITSGVLMGMRPAAIRRESVRRLRNVMHLLEGSDDRAVQASSLSLQDGEDVHDLHIHLTSRQIEVLSYRWRGLQPKEIAYMLGLKESTVRGHIRDAIECLGVRGSEAAVHKAHILSFIPQNMNVEGK